MFLHWATGHDMIPGIDTAVNPVKSNTATEQLLNPDSRVIYTVQLYVQKSYLYSRVICTVELFVQQSYLYSRVICAVELFVQ